MPASFESAPEISSSTALIHGTGLHRGDTGLSVAYRFLNDCEIGVHDDRWLTYSWGVLGNNVGMHSSEVLVRGDSTEENPPPKCEVIKVKKATCFTLRLGAVLVGVTRSPVILSWY